MVMVQIPLPGQYAKSHKKTGNQIKVAKIVVTIEMKIF